MKLLSAQQKQHYIFQLTFENNQTIESDLNALIAHYVSVDKLNSTQVNTEWSCLEFNDGLVDIDPKTLYRYVTTLNH